MVNETSSRTQALPRAMNPRKVTTMPAPRAPGRQNEYEEEKPVRDGEPPHPAQEPAGGEDSSNSGETLTDPATGEPNP